jgi:hypothetical protein
MAFRASFEARQRTSARAFTRSATRCCRST